MTPTDLTVSYAYVAPPGDELNADWEMMGSALDTSGDWLETISVQGSIVWG